MVDDPDLSPLFGNPYDDDPDYDDQVIPPPPSESPENKRRTTRRKGACISDFTLEEIAMRLGGSDRKISYPGPSHSEGDRSLSIKLDAEKSGGFVVYSHAGDDWPECRDYVVGELGLSLGGKPRKPRKLMPKEQAEREALSEAREKARSDGREHKLQTLAAAWKRMLAPDKKIGDYKAGDTRARTLSPIGYYLASRGLYTDFFNKSEFRFREA